MKRWSLLALATAGIAFSACNNSANTEGNGTSDTVIMDDTTFDTTTVGERLDNGIDSVKQAGREAKSDINAAAADAKADATTTGQHIKEDVKSAKEDVGDAAKSAGKDIKNAAGKVADKTKEGYNDVKESLKKDTSKK